MKLNAKGKPVFEVGDRVKLKSAKARKVFHSMTHGMVIYYQGEHDPKNPRVRWESGWGVTSKSEDLMPLTDHEMISLPPPSVFDSDLKTVADYDREAKELLQKICVS
jgi:hypothetical protein